MNQLCVVEVGEFSFGIPVQDVQEVVRGQKITHVPLAHPAISGLTNVRGQVVTVIDMRRQLATPDRTPEEVPIHVVVRDRADGLVSLLVDDVIGVVDVNPDQRKPRPDVAGGSAWPLIDSMYKLPERLLLVLDTERAISVNWAERESA